MDRSRFDLSNEPDQPSARNSSSNPPPRPFLGIHFQCCRVYGRIYRNDQQTAYSGQCPKCKRRISVPIGSGGTGARFFNAS